MGRLRTAVDLVQGSFNSAFSTGAGYEPQPRNPDASFDRVERYYLDLRAKTKREIRRVVTGHGTVLSPSATTVAQSALGWWERRLDGDDTAEERFLQRVDELLDASDYLDGYLVWRYDVPVPKYGLVGGWYSAMAQGQAASVLVRAYLATGNERYARGALSAARAMTILGARLGIARRESSGVVYEECPSNPPSKILNGWIFALWGLHDVGTGLGAPELEGAFEDGAETLAQHLPQYDIGWWSRYSLFPGQAPDLAKPAYHTVHADQLMVMDRLTRIGDFGYLAANWRAADTIPNRAKAVVAKGRQVCRSLQINRNATAPQA